MAFDVKVAPLHPQNLKRGDFGDGSLNMSDNWDSDADDNFVSASEAAAKRGSHSNNGDFKSGWSQNDGWDRPGDRPSRGGRGRGRGRGLCGGGEDWDSRGGGRRSHDRNYGSGRFRHANYEENIWGGGAGTGVDSWGAPYRGGRGGGRGGRGMKGGREDEQEDRGWGGYRGSRGSRGGGYRDTKDGFGSPRRGRGGFGSRGGGGRDYENGFERRRRFEDDNDFDDDGWDRDAKPTRENYVPKEDENEEHLFADGISSGINFAEYDNVKCRVTGDGNVEPVDSFEDCGLRKLLVDNIRKSNYTKPTPVQRYAIPIIMANRDMMACAQTGSGKTAAFLVPMIHKLLEDGFGNDAGSHEQCPEILIITPTRELAIQIKDQSRKFCSHSNIKSVVIYGGTSVMYGREIIRKGTNILVATPGRLVHFLEEGVINLRRIKFLVLDEADRMLDMGFLPDINRVVRNPDMPSKEDRVTLMFSATFPELVQNVAAEFLNNYLFLAVGIVGQACKDVRQSVFRVRKSDKREQLIEILKDCPKGEKTLVFLEMKKHADFLAAYLSQTDFPATSMHGDRLQREREEALFDFKRGEHSILVATAVAARGLDIPSVAHVINYDLPGSIDEYVHRIGRTGRIGNKGKATSFYDPERDAPVASDLLKVLSDSQQEVPEWLRKEAADTVHGAGGGLLGSGYGGRDVRQGRGRGRGGGYLGGGMNDIEEYSTFKRGGPVEEDEMWD